MRMNIKVGFPADLVAPHLMAPFIFTIHQNVAQVEILNEDDGSSVIQNILQPLFACAKCLFCPPAFANLGQQGIACLLKVCASLFHSWQMFKPPKFTSGPCVLPQYICIPYCLIPLRSW